MAAPTIRGERARCRGAERLAKRNDQSESSSDPSWCASLAMILMSHASPTAPHGAGR